RVELARDEPWMIRQLDYLDQPSFLECPGHGEPRLDERRAVVVIHLVAVSVPLVHHGLAVGIERVRSFRELDRLRAEPHRAAEILDLLLLGKEVDHRMRCLRIHLRRVGALETEHVPGEFRHRYVHTEANPEIRDQALTRDPAREDLALPAPRTEATGNEHAVDLLEQRRRFVVRHVLRVYPAHVHATSVMRAGMLE